MAAGAPRPANPANPVKDRALPHIGRDAVKISSPDGTVEFRRAGDNRARYTRRGKADECDHPFR
jgi:hypothetical protein